MRTNFVILLFFTHLIWCQQEIIAVKDSDEVEESEKIKKDTLNILEKKIKKRKSSAIFIKPMSDVTINDYKIMYLDGTEESVDTSLSLEREYSFNFFRIVNSAERRMHRQICYCQAPIGLSLSFLVSNRIS